MSLEMPSMHKVLLFGSWQRHALQTSMLKRSSILVSKGGGDAGFVFKCKSC